MKWLLEDEIVARIIDLYDDKVLLECLIDKEQKIYEEREFNSTLFIGYELKIGEMFKLCFYTKPNQSLLKVKRTKAVFPNIDFVKKFSHLLFKK